MKYLLIFILLSLSATCKPKTERVEPQMDTTRYSTSVAYSKGEYIFYYSKESEKHGKLLNCDDPSFSPDGSKLAYTEYYESDDENAAGPNRRIKILDVKTGLIKQINYDSHQYFGPVWSHDGKQIAFNAFFNGVWNIVLVDSNLNYRKILNQRSNLGYSSISWANNNTTILAHNLDTLFMIDTSNIINHRYLIKDIAKNTSKSSSMVFTLTPDNKSLIFNSENIDASLCNGENEFHVDLPNALYRYDLADNFLVKLTPDTLYCADYEIHNAKIYFSASKKCDAFKRNVYTIDMRGTNLKEFIKEADNITVSNSEGN